MRFYVVSVLLLMATADGSDRFLLSAPSVFHLGVKEKVFVQLGSKYLNRPVSLYLVHESTGTVMSDKKTVRCTTERDIKTVELMIKMNEWLKITRENSQQRRYLNIVAEVSDPLERKYMRVLVSNHRGYIFIQTDQPMYNPSQKVKYRVFTLDHTMRPTEERVNISVFNADGSRIMESMKSPKDGIFRNLIPIPSVSKMGTWKITAHYEGDEGNVAVREFKVQRFVLPSFEVKIETGQRFILLSNEQLDFTISAMYSYGEKVNGSYHSQFRVLRKGATHNSKEVDIIKGLELIGLVQDGTADVALPLEKINSELEKQWNLTLSNLQEDGFQIHVRVFVTNIKSGEIQEAEVYLPIVSQKYNIDLSRTRSHFVPGFPLDVMVVMRLPDGTPAVGVPLNITVQDPPMEIWQGTTDVEGMVSPVFNIPNAAKITVKVSADGLQEEKIIEKVSSPSNSYLYMSTSNKVYTVEENFSITFNTVNGPREGFIYYMVLSRGIIIQTGSLQLGINVKHNFKITANMVPSFRVIGYFHSENGFIIADSVWVDVRDQCEMNVEVTVENKGQPRPAQSLVLQLDLHGQSAKVALLAVDKAFYGLKADNKLTAKQVFSSMKSYDQGCTYNGGINTSSVLMEAGLAFSSRSEQQWRRNFECTTTSVRGKRSVDIQQEMLTLKAKYEDPDLQECCTNAFSFIPMRRTCEERAIRVGLVKQNQTCVDVFQECCKEAERLRQKQKQEGVQSELGRTATTKEIEEYFLMDTDQYIRRLFPPSFAFTEFDVNDKKKYLLKLPDSITTWEVQVIALSSAKGFCVVKPHEVKAFKPAFVSLRLPYSVKRYEQLSIAPVIYNYGEERLQLAVNLDQTDGLCAPASATKGTHVTVAVEPMSSQLVPFSVVPMASGPIPIKIRLYDTENEKGLDAVEKTLNVQNEGFEIRQETTHVVKLDGRSSAKLDIDGTFPDDLVPDSSANVFVSVEGEGFGSSHARILLSPETVVKLIKLPFGCLEQTTNRLAPTVLALRYLDLSDQWFDLPPGSRDAALANVEQGCMTVLGYKEKGSQAYASFYTVDSSIWATAYVLKVMSLVGERQGAGLTGSVQNDIIESANYLISKQEDNGSFIDPNPVIHRNVKEDQDAWLTAFITLALRRSKQFLTLEDQTKVQESTLKATTYLQSRLTEIHHTYAMALTAYCLAACLPQEGDRRSAWKKLQSKAITGVTGQHGVSGLWHHQWTCCGVISGENHCYMWTSNPSPKNKKEADAITVETTAYALLTAVELEEYEWAEKIACWLTTQENYHGGYKTTQDTVMALEALSEYELKRPTSDANMKATLRVPGKSEITDLEIRNKKEKVETDLKKLTGNMIEMQLTGTGSFKVKSVKAFYVLDPVDYCSHLSISVKVEGKVQYTAPIKENYDYYEDYDDTEDTSARVARHVSDEFAVLPRSRRDVDNKLKSDSTVTYTVCVSANNSLTGMAIADITLLSGFEAKMEDLERLKMPPEQYISHYELSFGRVLIYYNELLQQHECISFDAVQLVPIGLLQPAPAVFYDYYEPNRKCTVFYSAPKRSKMVSKLCSEDVCQCAERSCYKMQDTFKSDRGKKISKTQRSEHACFFPRVDYAYMVEIQNVSLKSNFELYKGCITDVLRLYGDLHVSVSSVRVFARRLQCKGELQLGREYLIMGKDGLTKDSHGEMQYLLESNTWVEPRPLTEECKKSANRDPCQQFNNFIEDYKLMGCTQ
nr:complement C4-B isoform X1 [Nothobranchius furzeri]XP_054596295.1 complement C4-B isoform X1 [Nothobranchius furzeri]